MIRFFVGWALALVLFGVLLAAGEAAVHEIERWDAERAAQHRGLWLPDIAVHADGGRP